MQLAPELAVAIVTSIVGPIVVGSYFRRRETRSYIFPSVGQETIFDGVWAGTFLQEEGVLRASIPVRFELHTKGKRVTGDATATIETPDLKTTFKLRVAGGRAADRFLRLDYDNVDPAVRQFGSVYVELSNDGTKLRGIWAGYGHKTGGFVGGSVEMHR